MVARSAERMMSPLSQTASEALWGRSFSAASSQTTSSRVDDEDVVVLLSDETAASEAAPLISHNAVKHSFCGGVSGALAKTCTAPLARLTILYQVRGLSAAGSGARGQQMGVVAALRHITATEGVCALWKGNLVTIIHRIPYSATNFFTYEYTKAKLQGRLANESARAWIAGAMSGLVACTVAYPLDLLRTRIAADTSPLGTSNTNSGESTNSNGRSNAGGSQHPRAQAQPQLPQHLRIPTALRQILTEWGVVGLYKGLGATLMQVVPGLAFNFCFYDTFKHLAMKHQQQYQMQVRHRGQQRLEEQQGQGTSGGELSPLASCVSPLSLRSHPHPHPQQQQGQQQHHQLQWYRQLRQLAGVGRSCSTSSSSGWGGAASNGQDCSGSCSSRGGVNSEEQSKASKPGAADASTTKASDLVAAAPVSLSPLTCAACACLSGLCTSSLTFPLDVVRRRLQVYERGALARMRYLDVVKAVYAEGGVVAFYRGLGPEFAKVLPGMAIAFSTYETLKRLTGAA